MTVIITPEAVIRRASNLLANELSEHETVMLDVERGTYYGLQNVAKAIWDRIEQPTTYGDLCRSLVADFDVDEQTCHREVAAFLGELRRDGLVTIESASSS